MFVPLWTRIESKRLFLSIFFPIFLKLKLSLSFKGVLLPLWPGIGWRVTCHIHLWMCRGEVQLCLWYQFIVTVTFRWNTVAQVTSVSGRKLSALPFGVDSISRNCPEKETLIYLSFLHDSVPKLASIGTVFLANVADGQGKITALLLPLQLWQVYVTGGWIKESYR